MEKNSVISLTPTHPLSWISCNKILNSSCSNK